MSYAKLLSLLMPETIVTIAALLLLTADLAFLRRRSSAIRMRVGALLAGLGVIVAAVWLGQTMPETRQSFLDGLLVISPLSHFIKGALLLFTLLTALLSVPSRFTDHAGEYFALLLLATVGMMFLVSTENILMIFVSLELLSLSLYILTAFNKENIASAEAALKYFLFGGTSAAVMLFGLSLIYGASGQLSLEKISAALQGRAHDPVVMVGLIMTMAGFGFKVAAVPFHLWAPDAYQGAPIPSAAFIASGSKVASFFVLAKVLMLGFEGAEGSGKWGAFSAGWISLVAIMAGLSVLIGNLAAIVQTSVRRLLAYSAVAHAGYMLIGILADQEQGMASLLYYVLTYAATTLGAFAVVGIVQDQTGEDRLTSFAGLSRRAPVLSFCMMIFLLSLAGIPPLAGFFGKFYLFAAALNATSGSLALLWLVILAIAMSAVSLYYYLQVLKQIYVAEPATEMLSSTRRSFLPQLVVVVLAAAVLILGLAPNLLVSRLLLAIGSGSL